MNNKNYTPIGLKASYCLPYVTLVELAAISVIIVLPNLVYWHNHLFLLNFFIALLSKLRPVLVATVLLLTAVWLVMLAIVIKYQRGNSFRNYCSSWFQTFELRNFAKIPAKYVQVKENGTIKNQKFNDPGDRTFNGSVKAWYVDIGSNTLTVWLLMPVSSDSQVIFDQKLPTIENKIRQDNPNFTFSPAERIGNFYRIEATRY